VVKSYLAFDLGASSGRAIIGRIDGECLSLEEVHRFVNGPMEKDGALFWDFPSLSQEILTGLKKALEKEPGISSIAIDTWGVDYVLFSKTSGEMVRLPYHYRDSRTDNIPEKVYKIIPQDKLYERTGIQYMQLNTLYQLVAHNEQHPEDFNDSVMLLMPDALTYILNGEMTCEYTEATTTNLLDPVARNWDFELIDMLGLPRSIFPEIVESCTVSAPLKPELQKELGCGPISVVKIGSHDTASAVAAVPAPTDRNWAYVSCGTWALLGAEIDSPILTGEAGEAPFTNEGTINNKIRFLTNIMGTWLFQETRRVWNEAGRNISFAEMEKLSLQAKGLEYLANPNDGLFLNPGNMPERIAEFCRKTGQGEIPGDSEVLRCIYDSLALYFRSKLEKLEKILGVEYQCLNIVGGGTKDRRLMQLTADALGIPVEAGPVEATAVGNILGQGIADGDIASLDAARQIVKNSFEVIKYEPDTASKGCWDAAMAKFSKVCG
jgi:sugar (pentulose or hexulose) kinase